MHGKRDIRALVLKLQKCQHVRVFTVQGWRGIFFSSQSVFQVHDHSIRRPGVGKTRVWKKRVNTRRTVTSWAPTLTPAKATRAWLAAKSLACITYFSTLLELFLIVFQFYFSFVRFQRRILVSARTVPKRHKLAKPMSAGLIQALASSALGGAVGVVSQPLRTSIQDILGQPESWESHRNVKLQKIPEQTLWKV